MTDRTRFLVWISAAIAITADLKARTPSVAQTQRPVFKTEAKRSE